MHEFLRDFKLLLLIISKLKPKAIACGNLAEAGIRRFTGRALTTVDKAHVLSAKAHGRGSGTEGSCARVVIRCLETSSDPRRSTTKASSNKEGRKRDWHLLTL